MTMRSEYKINTYVLVLLSLALTSPAQGMVYSWIDSAGIAHYTNKEYEIPVRYRARVKARYPEHGDTGGYTQSMPPLPAKAEIQKPAAVPSLPVSLQSVPPTATPTLQNVQPSASMKKMRTQRNRASRNTEE